MIPKRIFFYWENDKMSWMRYMTLYSFRKMNPDWEMDLFFNNDDNITEKQWKTGNEQDFHSYDGVDYFDKIKNLNINIKEINFNEYGLEQFKNVTPSGKSDIFKWYELYKNGGVFSDMDILFFRPMDDLYNDLIDNKIDTVICQTKYLEVMNYLSVGFLASTKDNDFYGDIFNNCFNFEYQNKYQTFDVDCVYDLYGMTFKNNNVIDVASEKYENLNIFNLPFNVVYPFDSVKIDYCFTNDIKIDELPSETIGYHWYAGHPTAQKYNNLLIEENYRDYNILFTNLCKHILD